MLMQLLVAVIVAGLVIWLLTQLPLDATLVRIARAIIIVAFVLYVLRLLLGQSVPAFD